MDTITDTKPTWLKESSSGTSAYYGTKGLANQVSAVTIGVTDGAQQSAIGILKTLKEKAIQAATDTSTEVDRAAIQKEIDQLIDQIDEDALLTFNGKFLNNGARSLAADENINDNLAMQKDIGAEPNNNVIKWQSFDIIEGEKVIFDNNNYLNIVNANVGIKTGSIDGIAKNSQIAPTIDGIVNGADNFSSLSGDFIGNYADGNGGAIYYANSGVIIDDKIQPEQTIAWFGIAQNYNSKVSSAFLNLVALENSSDFVL